MFCLDTNVIIGIITGRAPASAERLASEVTGRARILVPIIVIHELRFGIARSARRGANEDALAAFLAGRVEILPFDAEDAAEAADIRAALVRKGTPIGPYDVLIAAQARRRRASLVTANVREFRRVAGLTVEDWAKP